MKEKRTRKTIGGVWRIDLISEGNKKSAYIIFHLRKTCAPLTITSFYCQHFQCKKINKTVLTSGDESSKEHSKSVMAVTTEGQEDADEDEDETSNDTLPGQADRSSVTQQVVQHVWLSLAVVTVAVYYKKRGDG